MARNALMVERAWAKVLPFTAVDIMEADDCEIEQPWPAIFRSVMTSPSMAR